MPATSRRADRAASYLPVHHFALLPRTEQLSAVLRTGGGARCRCGQQAAGALVCSGMAERTQLRPACLAW